MSETLSEKTKKFWAECLDLATTPEEDMLIKTIFMFITKQNAEAVEELKYQVMLHKETAKEYNKLIKKIDGIFGKFNDVHAHKGVIE